MFLSRIRQKQLTIINKSGIAIDLAISCFWSKLNTCTIDLQLTVISLIIPHYRQRENFAGTKVDATVSEPTSMVMFSLAFAGFAYRRKPLAAGKGVK